MVVQRIHFQEIASEVHDTLERYGKFIANFHHANAIVGKMKDVVAAMRTNKLPPRSDPVIQDTELAEIASQVQTQQDLCNNMVRFVLCAVSSAAQEWVQEAQSLAPQRKTRKSNPATYPHVSGLQRLLRNPVCYAVGTSEFTHLYSLLSLFISWAEDFQKFLAPGRDVIMARRATADNAVDDPFQAVAEAEQLERRVQRIPIRSDEASVLLWAQSLFTWLGDIPDLDESTMTWKQGTERMERYDALLAQLTPVWRTKLVEIGVLADASDLTFTQAANPLFEQAVNKAASLRQEIASAQKLAETAKSLIGDPRTQLAALQQAADEAADYAVQPDLSIMKGLYEKLGIAPPVKAAGGTPTKGSAASKESASSRKRRAAYDPDFMPFGDDDADQEDEEYVEDDGELEEEDDEAYEDPELLRQEMAEMRRTSERKRRATPAGTTSKRKRAEAQRSPSAEGAAAATTRAAAAATAKPKAGKAATTGKAKRCLREGCRRNATADSWYCSDTCAIEARQMQLQELLRFRSKLADWWCNSTQSRAMGLDQAARYFIRSGDAMAYGANLVVTDTMISNGLKESGLDLDSLLSDEPVSVAASTTDESDATSTNGSSSTRSGKKKQKKAGASLETVLSTVNSLLEDSVAEASAKPMGWKMDQFCLSLPACAEPLLANIMRPGFDGSKRVLCTAGPAELLSVSSQLKSEDFDKLYGPRLTVRQQFETIFVEAMKELGTRRVLYGCRDVPSTFGSEQHLVI
jgi:hypothetical protein